MCMLLCCLSVNKANTLRNLGSFVGQFLLLALLQRRVGLTVTCILPEDKGSTSMQESILWPEVERFVKDGSVRLVSGDLTKSQGIPSDLWSELSNSVDAVLLFSDDDDKILGNYQNIHECHVRLEVEVATHMYLVVA